MEGAVKASAAKVKQEIKTIHQEMSGGAAVHEPTFSTPIPQPPPEPNVQVASAVSAEMVGARRSFFEGDWTHKWSTGHAASITIDLSEASNGVPVSVQLRPIRFTLTLSCVSEHEIVWKVSNNMWHKIDCRLAVPEITSVDGSYCFSGPTRRWMDLRHPSANDDTVVWVTNSKEECYRRMTWHRKELGSAAVSFAAAFPRS